MFESFERDARLVMRACVVRGILLDRIFQKRTITYKEIAEMTKTLPGGGELSQVLSLITKDDVAHKRFLSVAIVVNSSTGIPGKGFFEQCRELGLIQPSDPLAIPDHLTISELSHFLNPDLDIHTDYTFERIGDRAFWLDQILGLQIDTTEFWDREIQRDIGWASKVLPDIPDNMWDNPSEGGLNAISAKLRVGGVVQGPSFWQLGYKPPFTASDAKEILRNSNTCSIPAYLLRDGDKVRVKFGSTYGWVQATDVTVDPVQKSAAKSASTRLKEPERFVHWTGVTDKTGEQYVEPLQGTLRIETPPDILERLEVLKRVGV